MRPTPFRIAQLCFLAAWLALASPWLFGTLTIPYDAKAHFQAQIQFLANALHSGQSPFWTPNVFVGLPQIADPQSLIFSPAFLLAYFDATPSFRQLDMYVLGLLALAGLAAIKLFEDRQWHPAGAILAAIAIAFGGSAALRIQHIGQVQSYAFFCIALWLVCRTLQRSSKVWGFLAGLAAGIMVVEPDQVSFLACYVLAGVVAGHWLLAPDRTAALRTSLAPLALAGVGAALLAAVPLALTVLYAMASNRPSIAFAEAARGSLHPASLLTFLIGDLYGAIDPRIDYWGPYSETWDPTNLTLSQNMSQLYLGAAPALLVLVVGARRGVLWARDVRALSLAALAVLLYALGAFTPVFEGMFRLLPGVGMFRRPADATFLLGALVSILAGYVFTRRLADAGGSARPAGPVAALLAVGVDVAIVAALLVVGGAVAYWQGRLGLAAKPIAMTALWCAASGLLILALRRFAPRNALAAVAATGVFMTADLAVNNGPNESTALAAADYDILSPKCRNETIRFLKERVRQASGTPWRDRIELVGLGFEWPNATLVHGFDHTLGYNPLRMGIVSTAVGAQDYIAGPDQRHFSPLFPSYHSMLANMLGLRFVLASVPIEQVDARLPRGALRLVARTKDAFIYENDQALPRVLFARQAMAARFDKLVADGRWPAFDPRTTVLLDAADPVLWTLPDAAPGTTPAAAPLRDGTARITRYENTQVEVEVTATQAGFLVLNDVWHPWWRADIDGTPAVIHKANVMFRAVHVEAGRHRVRFTFEPFAGAYAEARDKLLAPHPHP